MSEVDPFDPVGAYVKPIRSVLFIDDQFPTYAQTAEATEVERARALWRACTEQGWLCDIDNSAHWDTAERRHRLASCDLLVLDYHLVGDETVPALSIIRDLARDPAPNLVVVYTRGPQLNDVLLAAASWARGVSDAPVPDHLEDLEDSFEWTLPERVDFLSQNAEWKSPIQAACRLADIGAPDERACSALLEHRLRRDYNVEVSSKICPLDEIRYGEQRWFRCGNLFLVVVGKPKDLRAPEAEAEAFLRSLEDAVRSWNPHWLACLMAHSRRTVAAGAFRDDVLVPAEALQNGLLGYIGDPDEEPERKRRAAEIATRLLAQRSIAAATELGGHLLGRATPASGKALSEPELLHLNAFLCSGPFNHHHLHVGTIFVHRGVEPQYWVCATPACDMEPRLPKKDMSPWPFELDELRPMTALRLDVMTKDSSRKKALEAATRARHLFFWDQVATRDRPIVAACFRDTADPNPWLEHMFAFNRARIQEGGNIVVYRLLAKDKEGLPLDTPLLERITCEPVAQLRAPYAERVVQVVGGHVSRIGVDFVALPKKG